MRKTSTSQGTTEYTMLGDKLVHLNRRSVDMHFWYNDLGKPQVAWYNCDSYYYVYNQQGDVIALVNSRTNQEAVAYAYDAWGKQISCTGAMAATLGVENPFRYRGYIYDEETGWYYLMARYYRPDMGRFVSADTVLGETGALLSHNAFAYCENSPVVMADPSGHTAIGAQGFQTGVIYADIPIAVLMSIWIYSGKLSMQGSDSYALGSSTVLRKPTDEMIGELRSALDAAKSQMEEKREKTPERNPNQKDMHHIVAKAHSRAQNARAALAYAGISVEDPINKVPITARFHQQLHGGYYAAIETIFSPVTKENGYSPQDARIYCEAALLTIQGILRAIDKIVYMGE